ncbi:MAG: SpoIIE family protein phosphatase [Candidatus Eisenbacteria bacterium]|nr:SpoIIE family protein phosphatase [Candidatus Eisenbacteria bacterium]
MTRMPDPDAAIRLTSLQRELEELRENVRHLTVLNDVALALGTAEDLNSVLARLVQMTIAEMDAEQGAIWLMRQDEADPLQTLVRRADGYGAFPLPLRVSLAGWVSKNQATLRVENLGTDPRFPGLAGQSLGIRSVLAAPLRSQDRLIGVLALFNRRSGPFGRSEERLAAILGAQAAQIIENVQHTEQERLQEALKRDLQLASAVQQELLPRSAPHWEGYEVAGRNIPAREVGGDSFEFLDLGGGRVALAIADVSGKGVSAALLMASLHATLRCLSAASESVADCVTRVNRMLSETAATGRFATFFYAELDRATSTLRYCNAGHNFPVLLRAGGAMERLETGGLPLAVMADWKYEEGSVRLESGDVLLLYSDGVSEAEDAKGRMFGEEAVESALRRMAGLPASEIVSQLLRSVQRFAAGAPQADDQTVVVLRAL